MAWRVSSYFFTVAFDGLFKVRLGWVRVNDCPEGLENWPRRFRPPVEVRNRRKAGEPRHSTNLTMFEKVMWVWRRVGKIPGFFKIKVSTL